jgi:hypothetical protein
MKRQLIAALILTASVALPAAAQEEYRWNASLVTGGSLSGGDAMGGIGAELMREFGRYLEIGFHAYAQAEVSREYVDSSGKGYHMSSGYGTLVIKPKLPLGTRFELAFPLESGNGLLQYRYNGDYREDLRWTEEILDQVQHSLYSAGIEARLFFTPRRAVSLAAGYRGTGPLRTDLAGAGELNGFWGRIGYSIGF